MKKEDFIKLFSDDPNSDDVMTEINRLYDAETKLTADFATADAERVKYKDELDAANKRYRERFLSGNPDENKNVEPTNKAVTIESLFKDK